MVRQTDLFIRSAISLRCVASSFRLAARSWSFSFSSVATLRRRSRISSACFLPSFVFSVFVEAYNTHIHMQYIYCEWAWFTKTYTHMPYHIIHREQKYWTCLHTSYADTNLAFHFATSRFDSLFNRSYATDRSWSSLRVESIGNRSNHIHAQQNVRMSG